MKKALLISDLSPAAHSRRKRKRVGRGEGSGSGKTSGKGEKGQRARAGYSVGVGFEGGQMPQIRRTPKRGFTSPFPTTYKPVNLDLLNRFSDGAIVDPTALYEGGIIDGRKPVKILAKGKLERKLTVKAHAFSAAARQAIESAGGAAEVLK